MIYVETPNSQASYPAAGWHVDDAGYLHIRKAAGGNAATYPPGGWTSVAEGVPGADSR